MHLDLCYSTVTYIHTYFHCVGPFRPSKNFEYSSNYNYEDLPSPLIWYANIHNMHMIVGFSFPLSLSTLVLNSRDWSEIIWLPEISRFKINLAISFIRKKPAGMHWLGYNDAVSLSNEVKTRIFQPTANFENFEIHPYFVSQPASQPACCKTRFR